jgi:DNA-binding NarL/FixJ family response regulator
VLVDDLPEMIEYCRDILETSCDVVGTAADGPSGIAAFEALQPDVLVLDISMPGMNGIEVARQLRASGCRAAIVFVSSSLEYMAAAMEAGGSAFVAKNRIAQDLRTAVSEALAGRVFVSGG